VLRASHKLAARPSGLGLLRLVHDTVRATEMLCRDLPGALRGIGAEAVIADSMEPAGGLVAEALGLPFVSVASALPINREPAIPLPFVGWPYDPSERGLTRNRGGERVSEVLLLEQRRAVARHAARFGLARKERLEDCLSPLAQISQTVASFDFPRQALPPHFHHVGPLRPAGPDEAELPYAVSPDRHFIFASLGTLQGGRGSIFRAVARACRAVDAQLLVAHCGGLTPHQAERLGATWVTDFAPQRAVLARATVAVTHAGLNTALDALSFGVPMLAIPLAFDQPGVAARIVHHGVGERLSPVFLRAGPIEAALRRLIADPAYRSRAEAIGADIAHAGGVTLAAEIIMEAVATRRPVLAGA